MNKLISMTVVASAILFSACGQQAASPSDSSHAKAATQTKDERLRMGDFVAKLRDAGLNVGEPKEKLYVMLGAANGAGFDIDGDSIEVYEFDTSITSGREALERLRNDGFGGQAAEIHKNLAILVHDKSETTDSAKQILFSM